MVRRSSAGTGPRQARSNPRLCSVAPQPCPALTLKTIVLVLTVRPLSVTVSVVVNRCFWASRRRPVRLSVMRTFLLLPAWIVTFSLPRTTVLMRRLVWCDFAAVAMFDVRAVVGSWPVSRM